MKSKIPSFLLECPSSDSFTRSTGALKVSFLEKGIHRLAQVIRSGYIQWETASKDGYFQRIDARIKVLFLLIFVVIVSLKRDIPSEALIGGFVFMLAVLSRLEIIRFYKRVLFLGFFFGFLIAFPSAFNVVTEGEIIFPVYQFSKTYQFWMYQIPKEIGITREGLEGVILLTLRVINSVSISFLVLYTTPFPDIIKALKLLKVPDRFLMVITLSYKYIFIFTKTVEDMHLAKKSRLAGQVNHAEARRWIAGRFAFIFAKTRLRCEEIFKAMMSKGFCDDIRFFETGKLKLYDLAAGGMLFLIGGFFLWL
jgi:cobalt ECF transporter T component CbiQ